MPYNFADDIFARTVKTVIGKVVRHSLA